MDRDSVGPRRTASHRLGRRARGRGDRNDLAPAQQGLRRESNGPIEGQINRLKVIKLQMYGRAGIELLSACARLGTRVLGVDAVEESQTAPAGNSHGRSGREDERRKQHENLHGHCGSFSAPTRRY